MSTFLPKANYSTEALQGLMSEGAYARIGVIDEMIEAVGYSGAPWVQIRGDDWSPERRPR